MSRLLPLALSGTLFDCAVCAAPAPLPKPWINGWDKPVDPLGDCKFRREGDVLTIKVPGKDHSLVKVGVYAATTSSAPFKPRFDQFKLTPGKKKGG